MNHQQLLEELRSGNITAKQKAGEIFHELLSNDLDSIDLRIIGNAVADCPENQALIHDIDSFWIQLKTASTQQTVGLWISVLFNLYNGTTDTQHLELVGNALVSWLIEWHESIPEDLALDLFLRSTKYMDSKSISVEWNNNILDRILEFQQDDNDDVNTLEILAHMFGIKAELEEYMAKSPKLILKTLELVKYDNQKSNWGISVLGTVSSSTKFIETVQSDQGTGIIEQLKEMIRSNDPFLTSISGTMFGNLIVDSSSAIRLIDDKYIDIPIFIRTCYKMNAIQLQCLHLLKNLSNDAEILNHHLLTNGITELVIHVLEIKVFPLITRIAAITARNILKQSYDLNLINLLINQIREQEDVSIKDELIRSTAIPNHSLDNEEYLLLLLEYRPPTIASTLALGRFPPNLLTKYHDKLIAFLKECQTSENSALRNNAAYLAAIINEGHEGHELTDIITKHVNNEEQN